MSFCQRCAAGLLPGATVCNACCAPVGDIDHAIDENTPLKPQDPLSSWPFGGADAQTVLAVSSLPKVRDVMPQLMQFADAPEPADTVEQATSLRSTYDLADFPVERGDAPFAHRVRESESVASVGPNPFLPASRTQSPDEASGLEAYSA